jgi:hypothetical protein
MTRPPDDELPLNKALTRSQPLPPPVRYLPPVPPALLIKPKPEEFLLRFNALTAKFDAHLRDYFDVLVANWGKKDAPVRGPYDDNGMSARSLWRRGRENAEDLIQQLRVIWSEQDLFAAASCECITMRLGRMYECLLPSSEVPPGLVDGLINHVVAAAPSAMALESCCIELETERRKMPVIADMVPVLHEHKREWARRMRGVDVERIQQLGEELVAARNAQYTKYESELLAYLEAEGQQQIITKYREERLVLGNIAFYVPLLREGLGSYVDMIETARDALNHDLDEATWDVKHAEVCRLWAEAEEALKSKVKQREREAHEQRVREADLKRAQEQQEREQKEQRQREQEKREEDASFLSDLPKERRKQMKNWIEGTGLIDRVEMGCWTVEQITEKIRNRLTEYRSAKCSFCGKAPDGSTWFRGVDAIVCDDCLTGMAAAAAELKAKKAEKAKEPAPGA